MPFLCDSPAITDLHTVAYPVVPLTSREGRPIGSLCVADGEPRTWSPGDIEIVRQLADAAAPSLRVALRRAAARAVAGLDTARRSH